MPQCMSAEDLRGSGDHVDSSTSIDATCRDCQDEVDRRGDHGLKPPRLSRDGSDGNSDGDGDAVTVTP